MSIQRAARGYLHQAPADWLRFTEALARRLARHVAVTLPLEQSALRTGPVVSDFADSFLAVLMSPPNVYVIGNADSQSQAEESVARCIRAALRETEIDVPASDGADYWDDIVDLSSWGPVRRWDGCGDAYLDERPLMTLRSVIRPTLSDDDVRGIVRDVCQRVSDRLDDEAQRGVDATSLVRLDLIDLALYRTLLKHPELLRTLDWRTFERLLADILETFGYSVELQRATKDGGIDILALKSGEFGQHRYLIQAKRWSNRVGVEPVRQLLFLHSHHRVTKSCLATTSVFTEGAWALATQYRWQLELRDLDGIRDWVATAVRLKRVAQSG